MKRLLVVAAALASLCGASLSVASTSRVMAKSPLAVTDLHEIVLKSGPNTIHDFTGDGRDALVVEGVRNYFTADGTHDDVMILIQPKSPGDNWDIVPASGDASAGPNDLEVLSNTPHTGEDMVRSFRFARGVIGGVPAMILIAAVRDFVLPIPAASHVVIKLYRLQNDPDVAGYRFVLFRTLKTPDCYSNSDAAVAKTVGLPVPQGYEGPSGSARCGSY